MRADAGGLEFDDYPKRSKEQLGTLVRHLAGREAELLADDRGGTRTLVALVSNDEALRAVHRMSTGIEALTEREKETLRLLLRGHAAKSIARIQGLSVHTVNERLRDARRKLGVSSSREAATQLGESEQWSPNPVGDKQIGVAQNVVSVPWNGELDQRRGADHVIPWLLGGTLVMSLIVAAVLLSSTLGGSDGGPMSAAASPAASASPSKSAATKPAGEWVRLVDAQNWERSWRTAGTLFRSQVTASNWADTIEPVRKPLGAVSSRAFLSTTKHSSLPGVPAGEYEIVEFKTDFANKKDAVETVVLARESSGWKVVGYFIR